MNYDLIITTNSIKKNLLLERTSISSTKIITIKELEKIVYGSLKEESIIFLMKKFNLSLYIAKVYLKNVLYKGDNLKKYYNALEDHHLIEKSFDNNEYKNILLINVLLDKNMENYFSKSTIDIYEQSKYDIKPINYFETTEEEILYVAEQILELSNEVSLQNIKLVNIPSEYIFPLKKVFDMHNIPINYKEKTGIYKTKTCIKFFKKLKDTLDVKESLKTIPKNEIYNKLVSYFNANNYDVITSIELEVIEYDLKNISLSKKKLKESVELINIEDIYNKDNHYFIMGFNSSIPKTYKDEDFYMDSQKESLGLLTSNAKNKNEYKKVLSIIKSVENIVITYSTKNSFVQYQKSNILIDYNLSQVTPKINHTYSDEYNKHLLSLSIDKFIAYNVEGEVLQILNNTYDIEYKNYSNKFTSLSKEKASKEIKLSYSSLNTYNECSFKYYVEKILKINKFESSTATIIGNTFHYVLSKIYEEDFDIDKYFEDFITKEEVGKKDLFYVKNVKQRLEEIINYIREFDNHTKLINNDCEKEVLVDVEKDKIKLYGIVDNIKYNEDIMAIIDYKTGSTKATLDNINYGFNMQLPIYIYLSNKLYPNKKFGGIYLHKILQNYKADETSNEVRKRLMYDGYTNSSETIMTQVDSGYANSRYIDKLSMTSNGLSKYSKVLDNDEFEKLLIYTEKLIKQKANAILDNEFSINPFVDQKENDHSCKYCSYKDLCYVTNKDKRIIEQTKYTDVI